MKKLAFLVLLVIAGVLSSCGSNHIQELPTSSISGNWEAQLTGGIGPAAALNFVVNFNLFVTNGSGNQNLNINNFSWLNTTSCFPPVPPVKGYVNLTNNINTGQVTGTIVLTIGTQGGNVLTLSADPTATPPTGELIGTAPASNGQVSNGGVNGLWTLTTNKPDSGCSAGDSSATVKPSFVMCQNATSCKTALGPSIAPSLF